MHLTKLRSRSLLNSQLIKKNYLQNSVFLDLMVIKQEKVSYTLQKATEKATSKVVKSWLIRRI